MCLLSLDDSEKPAEPEATQDNTSSTPSTSKAEEGKPVKSKLEEPSLSKTKVSENLKHESDSETQNTSCSEESITEEPKSKIPGPLENLKLLASTIDELFVIVEKKV